MKFEVDHDSSRVSYEGYIFMFDCSGDCIEQVDASPGLYLDHLVEEAGGPAPDPDPNFGDSIDDD